jgi:hypothetical protein
MNNKTVLKKFPKAVCQVYKTQFEIGLRGKGVPVYIVKPTKHSKFSLGHGLSEKEAWQCALACIDLHPKVKMTAEYAVLDCE